MLHVYQPQTSDARKMLPGDIAAVQGIPRELIFVGEETRKYQLHYLPLHFTSGEFALDLTSDKAQDIFGRYLLWAD